MQTRLTPTVKEWLNKRGITDTIINEYEISYNGRQIVIPVHDERGKILFNKYRRDPQVAEGPKYQYDKGASPALYGMKTYKPGNLVVICEGELDCLVLLSKGITAVSSTGGCATFRPEWAEKISSAKEIFICFDNDLPGFKGSFHVQDVIGRAKIMWLPDEVGEHGDVTDFFTMQPIGKTFTSLMMSAKSYRLPQDWRECKTKKEMEEMKKQYAFQLEGLMNEARSLRACWRSDRPIQCLIEIYNNRYNEISRAIKYFQSRRENIKGDVLARAKAVPIPMFIKFGHDHTACCIWHEEKTPSMYYYEKQNRVKCFGCGKLGDVIDVVQKLNGCGLREAIKFILQQ